MLMEQLFIYAALLLFGLCMGSFAGAIVWRLRARQLVEDKAEGEVVDKKELNTLLPLTKTSLTSDRSRCLDCGHGLVWYDLIPIVSWVSTGGTCRYCHKKIGWFELLIEAGVAAFFLASYLLWPIPLHTSLDILQFGLWLVAGVLLAILFAYDLKWSILPDNVVFPLIGIAATIASLRLINSIDVMLELINLSVAVALLSGLYLLLWQVSRGAWIGFGDVKLGLGLALLLGRWELAFITLLLANMIGCIIVLPGLLMGKLTRSTHIPFGPLLIAGFAAAALLGRFVIERFSAVFY